MDRDSLSYFISVEYACISSFLCMFAHSQRNKQAMDSKNSSIYSFSSSDDMEQLKNNFKKVTSVLADHQIALWEYDLSTGECSFADEYFRILGLDKAGIFFTDLNSFNQCSHPEDRALYSREILIRMIESKNELHPICVRCVGLHGEIIWLEDHFFHPDYKEGHLQKLYVYTINVTSQHEKEAKILQLEERNRKIIDALPEFIFIFDDNFFIADVLMASNTELLHPVEELKGIDGRSVYSPEVSDLFLRNIRECLMDGQLKEIEYPLDVDGRERHYFQARIAPFEGNKVLALIHDIGERVQRSNELIEAKKRAEEADRMKSVFLANMSHEIRTPLNAIVGFSEIIAMTQDEQEKKEYLSIIQKNSNLLLQLINDILDLSRIESGKSEMNFQLTDISGLVDEVEKVHRLKMKSGIKLEVIRPQEEVWILVDRNRLTQVLFNFLSNAIKNTHEGCITLGLKVSDEWVKLYVTDTGCGIPEEKLPFIFDRFEKLNDFVQGTGLGLSICQSIVERLGGQIDVESKIGVGSTFSMRLPRSQVRLDADGRVVPDTSGKCQKAEDRNRKRILIAEDVEANYMQINILLKKEFTISWVTNGEEAVNSFLRERPDLILMDIRMPIMNGIQATEKIRSISLDIPIIAVTANAFYSEQQQALAAGCNDLIAKPYTLEKLKETIALYL